MNYLKNNIGKIIISVIFAILGVACSTVPYFGVAKIVSNLISSTENKNEIMNIFYIILLGFIGGVIFHEISTLLSHNIAFKIIEDTRKDLVKKLSRISMGTIEEKSSGQWTQFMCETLDKMEKPIAHVIPEVIANIIIPIVLVICIFCIDWRIGVANLITLPLGVLFSMLTMNGYEERSKRYVEASKKMNSTVVEYIKGIKVIKAFNQSASSYKKFQESVSDNRNSMLDWYLSCCFYMTAAMEVLPSTLLFVLPTSLYLFMKGNIDTANLVMCVLLSYGSYKPLIKAMNHMDTMANIRVVISEIKEIMLLPELDRPEIPKTVRGCNVEFKNVSFAYKDEDVFTDLSFQANGGQLTAIVGPSGSGKSTIAKLLAGFWNTKSGQITIGNVDLNEMPLNQNMELVTYVAQENFLFNKSIIDNMRMAKPNATLDEIKEACKKASCHEFIMNLPNGYNTIAGEAGGSFSGGERQRITIARALLKDSPIVVLDEATAYSDPENEALIQESINALVKNKTVIMIAHRLSTIVGANKIIVLNNGKIECSGKHFELLETCPLYKSMWNAHINAKDRMEVV